MAAPLTLRLLPDRLAVCRLGPADPIPDWFAGPGFLALTRTDDELSLVCAQTLVPDGVVAQRDWAGLKVLGPLDFALTGIMAGLSSCLAAAGISLFALSTYDTDYLLVPTDRLAAAIDALDAAGYHVQP